MYELKMLEDFLTKAFPWIIGASILIAMLTGNKEEERKVDNHNNYSYTNITVNTKIINNISNVYNFYFSGKKEKSKENNFNDIPIANRTKKADFSNIPMSKRVEKVNEYIKNIK